MSADKVCIRPLAAADAPAVAQLHIDAIETGFISSLGPGFVTTLYRGLAQNPHSFGWVAQQGGRVVGFVAFSSSLSRLYRSILFKSGPRLLMTVAGQLLSWPRVKGMAETLIYPRRTHDTPLPPAELLAIAVARESRGQGLARQLLCRGLQQCREEGLMAMKLCVGPGRDAACRLYESLGFIRCGQIKHHGIISQIYTIDLESTNETSA